MNYWELQEENKAKIRDNVIYRLRMEKYNEELAKGKGQGLHRGGMGNRL